MAKLAISRQGIGHGARYDSQGSEPSRVGDDPTAVRSCAAIVMVARRDERKRQVRRRSAHSGIPAVRLDALIKEAIVDAYTPEEQAVGFHATIEQHLALPFETAVLGENVTVKKIDVTVEGQIVAVCHRGGERQTILILDLPLPAPPPAG